MLPAVGDRKTEAIDQLLLAVTETAPARASAAVAGQIVVPAREVGPAVAEEAVGEAVTSVALVAAFAGVAGSGAKDMGNP